MEPPLTEDVGSTASTATLCPSFITWLPKDSINVDFPTPGAPDTPILIDPPV